LPIIAVWQPCFRSARKSPDMRLTFSPGRQILLLLAIWQAPAWAAPPPAEFVYKPTADRELRVRFQFPEAWKPTDRRAALIFFYNGVWPDAHAERQFDEQADYFAKRGMVTARADYREKSRTLGETPRVCIEDIYSALRWVRKSAARLGVDSNRIAIGAGSGSAHLPASVFYIDEIRAAGDDPSISPRPGAMLVYHPDLDTLDPEVWHTMLEGRVERARDMSPTVVFIGTRDPGYPAIQQFFGTLKKHGAPVELYVGEEAIHGFYKFSPWLEQTTRRADELLQSVGYLDAGPKVRLPSLRQPEAYGKRTEENQVRWLARHQQREAERAEWRARNVPAAPPGPFVYKTTPEGLQLTLAVHCPQGWKKDDRRTAMVLFEGGGFSPPEGQDAGQSAAVGSRRIEPGAGFSMQAGYFAKRGAVAVRVGYRKHKRDGASPEKAIEDAISAMRWVRKSASKLGIDPDRIVSAGGSSGGNLAASVACLTEFQAAEDDRSVSPRPNAMLLYFPLLDWLEGGSMTERFLAALGGDKQRAARLSPARHWNRDMPPALILIGTRDPMYPTLEKFAAKWKSAGAPIDTYIAEGGPHGFSNYSPWLEKSTARADQFLRSIGFLADRPAADLPARQKAR
jgi:acetyl esterase/lipase